MNEKQQPLFDTGDRRILAVLFAAGEPLELERLAEGLGVDKAALRQALERLQGRLQEAGLPLELLELEESVQLSTREEYGELIRSVLSQKRSSPLSQSAMEVLAIIAYYQPVTRAYVDQIRGVDSGYTVGLLLERELTEETGRLAVPGRPILYRTTRNFLRSFGLSSLEELPELPAASREGDQMALELEARMAQLKAEEDGPEEPESAGEREP